MYGNNFGYPFIGGINPPVMPPMTRSMINPMTMGIRGATRSGGLRSLLGLGSTARGATSGFSFTNLLNGASKTLGVVKDAIPIVKEVGPMMNNMKSKQILVLEPILIIVPIQKKKLLKTKKQLQLKVIT